VNPFQTEHKNMLSNLHAVISKGYLAVHPKYDKLITSMRTAYAEELSLEKKQTSYDDLFDALRLSSKGYQIESSIRLYNKIQHNNSTFYFLHNCYNRNENLIHHTNEEYQEYRST
jgi:hypothetical protein